MSTDDALPSGPASAREYADAVRAHLDDLPPDVAEELTGGLDADLAELAAESSTPLAQRLGDPSRYASELREAAGLAARAPAGDAGQSAAQPAPAAPAPRVRWSQRLDTACDEGVAWLRSRSWWPYLRDLATALRPAWWLARAWVVFELLFHGLGGAQGLLPSDLGALLVLLALAWGSVELGRGRWHLRSWLPRGLLVANAIAAVAVLPLAAAVAAPSVSYVSSTPTTDDAGTPTTTSTGLVLDGQEIANIFPYDAQGNPLTGVQLLDDRGRPITTGKDVRAQWEDDGAHPFVPGVDVDGRVRWNAYPLRASADSDGSGAATAAPRPVVTLPGLVGQSSADPSAAATASPTSTAGADPSASPTSTAGVDPGATATASPTS